MNKPLIIPLFFLAATSSATHFSAFEGKFDCPEVYNSKICARSIEGELSAQHAFIQRKSDALLHIALPRNKVQTFNDGETHYSVLEFIEEHDYLVLHLQYWEGNSFALLNVKTGEFHEITGYPLFSPDGQYVVVAQKDLEAGYSPNTLQIYIADQTLKLVYDAKPSSWGPSEVKRLSNTLLSFTKTKYCESTIQTDVPEELSNPYIEESAILELRDGKWTLAQNRANEPTVEPTL